jgi:hypothetical protein
MAVASSLLIKKGHSAMSAQGSEMRSSEIINPSLLEKAEIDYQHNG